MDSAICEAISRGAVIQLNYDGGSRTLEPHPRGTSTAGNEVLRGFQTSGTSQSGESVAWKQSSVSKISGLSETGATFSENRPDYNPIDEGMSVVHCYVTVGQDARSWRMHAA